MQSKRLFIIDPVCAQGIGHNLASLIAYKSYFCKMPYFSLVSCISSSELPSSVPLSSDVVRFFNFLYWNVLPIHDPDVRQPQPIRRSEHELSEISTVDFLSFISRFEISENDILFFPSVDYYSIIGIIDALKLTHGGRSPSVRFRFIDVLERSIFPADVAEPKLSRLVQEARTAGLDIRFSAETPKYAQYLAALFDAEVEVLPVPPDVIDSDDQNDGTFNVVSLGSGRPDKGFLLLPDIIGLLRSRYPQAEIEFKIQNLPERDVLVNLQTIRRLISLPGIELLPSYLTPAEMTGLLRNAQVAILPYDRLTYARRSSAILAEALTHGKLVATFSGSGFSPIVEYYGAGTVSNDMSELVDGLYRLYTTPRSLLTKIGRQARHRFVSDAWDSYTRWIQ